MGGWLFRHRSSIPVPLALLLLLVPASAGSVKLGWIAVGVAVVVAGECLRLWAVRHIGVISRTRSDRLGPLVSTGPFALLRNPLYVGNIMLWAGFAFAARFPWLAPAIVILLAFEYHAIVRWEEELLRERRGTEYIAYASRVPRWMPRAPNAAMWQRSGTPFSWRETIFSERGTIIAIVVGFALLLMKARL